MLRKPEVTMTILDSESQARLKRSLEKATSELIAIRKQKSEIRQVENVTSSESPSPLWQELLSQESSKINEIDDISHRLCTSKVIDMKPDKNIVNLNDSIKLEIAYSDGFNTIECYKLVGAAPDFSKNEISKSSDIGAAILGKKIDEIVEATVKNSGLTMKIHILAKI